MKYNMKINDLDEFYKWNTTIKNKNSFFAIIQWYETIEVTHVYQNNLHNVRQYDSYKGYHLITYKISRKTESFKTIGFLHVFDTHLTVNLTNLRSRVTRNHITDLEKQQYVTKIRLCKYANFSK